MHEDKIKQILDAYIYAARKCAPEFQAAVRALGEEDVELEETIEVAEIIQRSGAALEGITLEDLMIFICLYLNHDEVPAYTSNYYKCLDSIAWLLR